MADERIVTVEPTGNDTAGFTVEDLSESELSDIKGFTVEDIDPQELQAIQDEEAKDQRVTTSFLGRLKNFGVGIAENTINDAASTVSALNPLASTEDVERPVVELGGSEETDSFVSQANIEQGFGSVGSQAAIVGGGAAIGAGIGALGFGVGAVPGAAIGATVGKGVAAVGQGVKQARSTFKSIERIELEKDGNFSTFDNAKAYGASIAAGIGTSALEFISIKGLSGLFGKAAKESAETAAEEIGKFRIRSARVTALYNAAKKGGKGAVTEAVPEGAQEALDQAAQSASTGENQFNIKQIGKSTAIGAIVGQGVGTVAGGVDAITPEEQVATDAVEQAQVELDKATTDAENITAQAEQEIQGSEEKVTLEEFQKAANPDTDYETVIPPEQFTKNQIDAVVEDDPDLTARTDEDGNTVVANKQRRLENATIERNALQDELDAQPQLDKLEKRKSYKEKEITRLEQKFDTIEDPEEAAKVLKQVENAESQLVKLNERITQANENDSRTERGILKQKITDLDQEIDGLETFSNEYSNQQEFDAANPNPQINPVVTPQPVNVSQDQTDYGPELATLKEQRDITQSNIVSGQSTIDKGIKNSNKSAEEFAIVAKLLERHKTRVKDLDSRIKKIETIVASQPKKVVTEDTTSPSAQASNKPNLSPRAQAMLAARTRKDPKLLKREKQTLSNRLNILNRDLTELKKVSDSEGAEIVQSEIDRTQNRINQIDGIVTKRSEADKKISTDPQVVLDRATEIPIKNEADKSTADAVATIKDQIRSETFSEIPEVDLLEKIGITKQEEGKFSVTLGDAIASRFSNDKNYIEKAINFAHDYTGENLKDTEKPKPFILLRLYAGIGAKFDDVLRNGMVDAEGEIVPGTEGGVEYLLEPYDSKDKKKAAQQAHDTFAYMVAQRVVEKSDQRISKNDLDIQSLTELAKRTGNFDKLEKKQLESEGLETDPIAGISVKNLTERQTALKAIETFESSPDFSVIQEASKRYRVWANANMTLLKDRGLISEKNYQTIIDNNEQYIAMQRIFQDTSGEDIETVLRSSSALGGFSKVINKQKGSAKLINDPYLALLQSSSKIIRDADRNDFKRSFTDSLKSENPDSKEALSTIGKQIKETETKGNPNILKVLVDGETEYWELQPDIANQMKKLDGKVYSELENVFAALPRLLRNTITYTPAFAVRNKIRDVQSWLISSYTGGIKNKELTPELASKIETERGELTANDLARAGGGQAGFYMNDKVDWHRAQKALLKSKEFQDNTVLIPSWDQLAKFGDNYADFIQSFETSTRLAEFRQAYKKARTDLGYNEREAKLYAAYQARELIDFAVAGSWMREINRYVPFSNAAVRGLVRSVDTIKTDPKGFMARWALVAVAPVFAERAWNAVAGADDEYDQLPAYRKDMYLNYKAGNMWLSIPKPFEFGVMASGVARAYDAYRGKKDSFEGYSSAVANALSPVGTDASFLAGPFAGLVQAAFNRDAFRGKYIVPFYEENLPLSERSTGGASKIAKKLQNIGDAMGVDVVLGKQMIDARTIDFMLQQQFGNVGRIVTDTTNVKSLADIPEVGLKHLLGITSHSTLSGSKDIKFVMDYAKENAVGPRSKYLKQLKGDIQSFYNASTPTERKELFKKATDEAKRVRKEIETRGRVSLGKDPKTDEDLVEEVEE